MLHCPAAKPGVATGLRERGLLSTAQVQCGKNGGFDVFLLGYIYLYILLLCYIAICLYIYIGIALFVYFSIACLQHRGITFFISIFYFCSLLRPLFFYDSGSRLSIIWLFTVQRYGGSVRYQTPGMPYSGLIRLKLFRNAFHKCCTFGFSKKLSTELFGVLTPRNHHLLMHVKRLYDDEMTE